MRKLYILPLFLALLFVVVNNREQTKNDTETPIMGGFLHMGPVLSIYKEGKYLLSIFNNIDNIEIEYYGWENTDPICKFSISQPLPEGFSQERVFPPGRYKISCGGKTKFYNSDGKRITISYR